MMLQTLQRIAATGLRLMGIWFKSYAAKQRYLKARGRFTAYELHNSINQDFTRLLTNSNDTIN